MTCRRRLERQASAVNVVLAAVLIVACRSNATDRAPARPEPNARPNAASAAHRCAQGATSFLDVRPGAGVHVGDFRGDPSGWAPPPELTLDVRPVRVTRVSVVVTAVLSNGGSAPLDAVTLSGGQMGVSTNPFNASLDLKQRPAVFLPGPEIHPSPTKVTLPAGGSVEYEVELCLERFETRPGADATVTWSFELGVTLAGREH